MFRLFGARPRLSRPRLSRPRVSTPARAPRSLLKLSGPTMGSTWAVACGLTEAERDLPLAEWIAAAVGQVDARMSTWKADSPLMRFNRAAPGAWVAVPDDLALVVDTAQRISRETGGAFDVTVGGAVDLWGFGPRGGAGTVPEARAVTGYRHLEVRRDPPALRKDAPVSVDLSGIAKGYGVDRIAEVLEAAGIDQYLVVIDGEARARGTRPDRRPWTLALEAPIPGAREAWDLLTLTDAAIATSGDYRHGFDKDGVRYSHTIDAATGAPIRNGIASVSVIHPSCMIADAWATALSVMGIERGLAVAEARNLPALFLQRGEDGVTERATPRFSQLCR